MNAELDVSGMRADEAEAVEDLFRTVVSPLTYYNQRALAEEVAKYRAARLSKMVQEDPDAILVARSETGLMGFCLSSYDDGLLWLAWFGVSLDARGLGVGTKLLEALEESAPRRRAHKVWCDTRTSNEASARVLERAGYSRIATLRNHWYGQDFYLWEKTVVT